MDNARLNSENAEIFKIQCFSFMTEINNYVLCFAVLLVLMIDMVFTLVCFVAGYLLRLCHIGLQLKASHPQPRQDLQCRIWNCKSGATSVVTPLFILLITVCVCVLHSRPV